MNKHPFHANCHLSTASFSPTATADAIPTTTHVDGLPNSINPGQKLFFFSFQASSSACFLGLSFWYFSAWYSSFSLSPPTRLKKI